METLHIRKFEANYRLPVRLLDQRSRLDGILADVLEMAGGPIGISPHEEICIRDLSVAVRLRLGLADSALAAEWRAAIAEAIRRADAVRYSSRLHALIDIVRSVMASDYARVWAWRQLGLWRGGITTGLAALGEIAAALVANGQMVVAVMGAMPPRAIEKLATDLAERQWIAIAIAACEAHGVSDAPGVIAEDGGEADEVTVERVERVLLRSSVLPLVAGTLPSPVGRALAALAILQLDAGLLRQTTAQARAAVRLVAERWRPRSVTGPARRSAKNNSLPRPRASAVDHSPRGAARHEVSPSQAAAEPVDSGAVFLESSAASTRFGGVLFLLRMVDELRLFEALPARPTAWMLHELALQLAPMEPIDPAALAFCGLLPDAPSPRSLEDPATEQEGEVLRVCVARIQELLYERVVPCPVSQALLLDWICRRRADIFADPGWIEAHYSLDEVSTELRRAGIDLDPGWLPWLGSVVRFVYE